MVPRSGPPALHPVFPVYALDPPQPGAGCQLRMNEMSNCQIMLLAENPNFGLFAKIQTHICNDFSLPVTHIPLKPCSAHGGSESCEIW